MQKKISIISIVCLLILMFLTYINATLINPKQLSIRKEIITSNTSSYDKDFLIAYFSDICFNEYQNKEYLENVVNTINDYHPDIILFAGDLIDSNYYDKFKPEDNQLLIEVLSKLNSEYGKYAVYGDQDLIKKELNDNIYQESGFDILSNKNIILNLDKKALINIVGIEPLVNGQIDINQAFFGIDGNNLTLVMSHCPDIFNEIKTYDFDYLLSGHSLGGQVYLPLINLFFREQGANKYYRGKYNNNQKTIDISNGIGRKNHNARLFADNEIVLYSVRFTSE